MAWTEWALVAGVIGLGLLGVRGLIWWCEKYPHHNDGNPYP